MSVLAPFRRWEKESRQSSTHPLFLQRSCNSLQTKHNQIHVGILNKNREGRPRGKNAIRITLGTLGVLPGVLQVFGSGSVAVTLRGVKVLFCSEEQTFHRAPIPRQPMVSQGRVDCQPLGVSGPMHPFLFLRLCLHAGGPGSARMFILLLWKGQQFLQLHILFREQHWA